MTTGSASTLVLVGVNYKTAPIEVRERLAIPAGHLPEATRSLTAAPGVREGLILSTCNRVELLTAQAQEADLLDFLHRFFAVPAATIRPHLYELRGREAVAHLFRVASSLDSMVVGEPQILGQVKEAYSVAKDVGAIRSDSGQEPGGGMLDGLLQRAFSVAKKVRSETEIGSSAVSIASVAVDLARRIFGSLEGKQVLLVGAGKMSELAARHLLQHGASSILVSNRTDARADRLATEFRRPGVQTGVVPFEDLYAEAHRADIVITSTGAPQQLFGRQHGKHFTHKRRGRPMFFIDIAVPRDVDPRINEVEGCFVYDVDDLMEVAQQNRANRGREAEAAERIVSAEVVRYQERLQTLEAVPAIRELQRQAEETRRAELERVAKALAGLTPEQRSAVDAMTRSLTGKLLHPQMVALRRGDAKTKA